MSEPRGGHPTELLSAYLDDELPFEERQHVDHHLAECAACRGELEALELLSAAVANEAPPEVPADLHARIGARIDRAQVTPIRAKRRFLLPVSVAATIAAVGLLVAFQWREGTFRQGAIRQPELDRSRGAPPVDELAPPGSEPKAAGAPAPSAPEPDAKETNELGRFVPMPPPPVPAETKKLSKDERGDEPAAAPARDKALTQRSSQAGPPERAQDSRERDTAAPSAAALRPLQRANLPGAPQAAGCAESWSDSGHLAVWEVRDLAAATAELDALADQSGGRPAARRFTDASTYELDVPKDRYDALAIELRAKGVTGLDTPEAPAAGTACIRQRIQLVVREPGAGD